MQNFTVEFFIEKFSAIPSKNIRARTQDDGNGGRCIVGWCKSNEFGDDPTEYKNTQTSDECKALEELFHNAGIKSVTNKGNRLGWNLADVNNGDHPDYQQSTPKKRIMAALNDVKNSVLVAS